MNRPKTTLFMLMSIDGKISTGDTDAMDFDHDLKLISGVKDGLQQYYDLEQQTDLVSLNTGRVMAKIGVNDRTEPPSKIPVSFVIVDNEPHLTAQGVEYLSKWVTTLYLITTNPAHPAVSSNHENVIVLPYEGAVNFPDLLKKLYQKYNTDRITVQSGGTLNATLLRSGLIDHLSLVIAPLLVGGKATPTLVDGESLHALDDLKYLKTAKLVSATPLKNSYLHLRYDVIRV
ncbi:MAG: dihydrofolate reductase family protein [Patescibacteria group bacterium]|jgi:2,5-diamino-6-(ribosylamino)-4(3H)-pyrimidinone 5'-phosphate reductase